MIQNALEPVAAVGEPPACVANRDRGGERPPDRQRHISDEPEDREGDPKYLPLHMYILDAWAFAMSCGRARMFQIQVPSSASVHRPLIPERLRHDP